MFPTRIIFINLNYDQLTKILGKVTFLIYYIYELIDFLLSSFLKTKIILLGLEIYIYSCYFFDF